MSPEEIGAAMASALNLLFMVFVLVRWRRLSEKVDAFGRELDETIPERVHDLERVAEPHTECNGIGCDLRGCQVGLVYRWKKIEPEVEIEAEKPPASSPQVPDAPKRSDGLLGSMLAAGMPFDLVNQEVLLNYFKADKPPTGPSSQIFRRPHSVDVSLKAHEAIRFDYKDQSKAVDKSRGDADKNFVFPPGELKAREARRRFWRNRAGLDADQGETNH